MYLVRYNDDKDWCYFYLSGLIQMMVAAQCQRQVYYSVYGDSALKHDLYTFHTFCRSRNITVGKCVVIIICKCIVIIVGKCIVIIICKCIVIIVGKCIVIIIMSVSTRTCHQSYSILYSDYCSCVLIFKNVMARQLSWQLSD